jgi:pyrroloquinoline-quinone synthase
VSDFQDAANFHDAAKGGLSVTGLEAVLREVGAVRYHNRHLFHHRMTAGSLSKIEMQAWALNRYCYQAVIPRKDAMILARATEATFRAAWRKRIEDHDGEDGRNGGIARWLHLAASLGLDAGAVESERLALPATRFAVGAYLSFCTNRTLLEAVASSLTELFSPVIIGERVPAMLAKYAYITKETLAYFEARPERKSDGFAAVAAVAAKTCAHPARSSATGHSRTFPGAGFLAERGQPRHPAPLRRALLRWADHCRSRTGL